MGSLYRYPAPGARDLGMWDDTSWIVAQAYLVGFDVVGVAAVDETASATESMFYWLAQGLQADMDWLQRTRAVRLDPRRRWPDLQAVVVVASGYPAWPTLQAPPEGYGRVSCYAWGRDYHRVLGRRLKRLVAWAHRRWPDDWFRWYVDTGPVAEKIWAVRAGVGWIGKHGNVIHPRLGSWTFLGVVLTSRPLRPAPHQAVADRCGTCTRCIDVCPTRAILAPGVVSAHRCISYWTIEHPGPIPAAVRPWIGSYLFGCDDCQTVCPWNRWAQAASSFVPVVQRFRISLREALWMDEAAFHRTFAGTPVHRLGWWRLRRNALVVIGNHGNASLIEDLHRFLAVETDPVLREHAEWALDRLARRYATLASMGPGLPPRTGPSV